MIGQEHQSRTARQSKRRVERVCASLRRTMMKMKKKVKMKMVGKEVGLASRI